MTTEPDPKPPTKIIEIPQILQAAFKQKIATVKSAAQQTYHQVIDKAAEAVDRVDTWAVAQVNENLDKVVENVDRQRQEAQVKLQRGIKQTQFTIQKKAKNTSEQLKNAAQSVLKKFKDS